MVDKKPVNVFFSMNEVEEIIWILLKEVDITKPWSSSQLSLIYKCRSLKEAPPHSSFTVGRVPK